MQVDANISYTIIRQIGIGQGMNSTVYLVDDPQLGGYLAAKEIEKNRFPNPTAYFAEAQTMFSVTHENVLAVQYACQRADTICLVMPYFQKGSLADRTKIGPLQLSEVLRVTQGVLAGLAHIHVRGYIHFDIKPSNVIFSDKDLPMVADFGQSREISATGVVKVPALYQRTMPPETIVTGVATQAADIYHVGLLMYRALNGEAFFQSQLPSNPVEIRQKICKGKLPDRQLFMPHVPLRLRTLVRKALRVNPSDRYQTATEMADEIGRFNLELDWSTEPLAVGGLRWRATRPGQCDLIVELEARGTAWSVESFTESNGEPRRAKERKLIWRKGLSRDAAFAHLKGVFERLLE